MFMTVHLCQLRWAERESLIKMGLSRGTHLVSCASDRGVLIDVVTCWGVSWGLRRERYFCSSRGSKAELSSGWWQLLTAFGSFPSFSTPGKVQPSPFCPGVSRCLFPSCFWKSRPSSPTLMPPPDSVSHCLSPGARCRLSVSMAAVCSAWAMLHCPRYYINRKLIRLHCYSPSPTSTSDTWNLCIHCMYFCPLRKKKHKVFVTLPVQHIVLM